MKRTFNLLILITLIFFQACSDDKNNDTRYLPPAKGKVDHIVIVIDSAQWTGPIGKELREIFEQPLPGLPQPEPRFDLNRAKPLLLNDVLRQAASMIYVTTLDNSSNENRKIRQSFSQASLQQIKEDRELFMHTVKDRYAKGQEVMFLFGQTEEQLLEHLKENRQMLRNHFSQRERKNIEEALAKGEKVKGLSKEFRKKYDFSLLVPMGYELAKDQEQFVWLRHFSRNIDKNLFVAWIEYKSEEAFEKENIIAFRDSLAKEHIYGDDRSESYMITERRVPVHTQQINFNGKYAIETRGLWRLNKGFMGGPFVSYTFVDTTLNRLYYIEGFLYAPGEEKIRSIKELEATLSSFQTKDELKAK
jgi:hypothetical protein